MRFLIVGIIVLGVAGGCGPTERTENSGAGDGVPVSVNVTGPGRVDAGPNAGCESDCTLYLTPGEPVDLSATATSSGGFVEWSGACEAFPNPCELTPSGGESVTATFAPAALRLELSGGGQGTFRIEPPGVDCSESCGAALDEPLSVAITYINGRDDTMLGTWGGACSGAQRDDYCVVSVDQETRVTKQWFQAPSASDDHFETDQEVALEVDAADGVLRNDADATESGVDAEVVTMPAHGSLDLRPDGSFTYQPDAGFVGADTFRYRVVHELGAASDAATVTVEVRSTNEAPSYDLPEDSVERDAPVTGPQEEPDFAQAIDPGAPDESGQSLSFVITRTSGNAPDFAMAPSISEAGTLRFEPSGPGTAEFEAVLEDDQGARSDARSFTITVRPRLAIEKDGNGDGSITSSPSGIDCGRNCDEAHANYAPGATVTLTADAGRFSSFEGWSGACTGTSETCEISMSASESATATFSRWLFGPPRNRIEAERQGVEP